MKKNLFLFITFLIGFLASSCHSEFPLPILYEAEILSTSSGDKILTSVDTSANIRIHGRSLANIDTVGLCSSFNCASPSTAGITIFAKTSNYVDVIISGSHASGIYYLSIARTENDGEGEDYTKTSNQIELKVN